MFLSSSVTGMDLMETPRSCSTNNVSVYRIGIVVSVFIVLGCVCLIKQSTKDVLPEKDI